MPQVVHRAEVRGLIERGAQLIDALPADEFERLHIRGAMSLPLRRIDADARAVLDPGRSIVVYCADPACDLSARAAWRLESLSFDDVAHYEGGKLDWAAAGLPMEGTEAHRPHAGEVARPDVPRCGIDEQLGEVRTRARSTGYDTCIVVNEDDVVLGILRPADLDGPSARPIGEVMRPGPSTFRPDVPIEEMADYMTLHKLVSAPITTSDGRLVGLLVREDAVATATRSHEAAA
jgi:rhodanese-related sulfurtransferase/CBS domain-containing protein